MNSSSGGCDLLVAAPNPALDSYYVVPALAVGDVTRAEQVLHTAGGKGNNLARAAMMLGGRVLSVGILGGSTGARILAELEREGIEAVSVASDLETRQCITLVRSGGGENTVVLEMGSPVSTVIQQQFEHAVLEHAWRAQSVVFTGSLPPGVPGSMYADLITRVKREYPGLRLALDASGDSLRLGALAGPTVVKVNVEELLYAFAPEEEWSVTVGSRIAAMLRVQGVELLIVTDGPRGAFAFPRLGEPLPVETAVVRWVSAAGAGDSFLAALLLAFNKGETLQTALIQASAAAAANLQHVICGHIDVTEFTRYLKTTRIAPLSIEVAS
jgi:tagatose 6-phosphate kinase